MNVINKVSDKVTRNCLVEKIRKCHFVDCKVQLELAPINRLRSTQKGGLGESTTENFIFVSDLEGWYDLLSLVLPHS